MPRRLNLPDTASVTTPQEGARLHAPSAHRNTAAIVTLITEAGISRSGDALEIASGTGQHVIALAAALPDLHWQPSDIDAHRRASIDAYAQDAALSNMSPAINLDATTKGWATDHHTKSLVLVVNLLHLISTPEAKTLISEAAKALTPQGMLIIYGPFMRDDELTSDGDRTFDASLRSQDPEIGYKSDFDVVDWGAEAGLDVHAVIEMPANNLALIWTRAD